MLFALRKVTTGDTYDLAPFFSVPKQAIMLGTNMNPLDRLHIAMPLGQRNNVEQLIGRIRRKTDDGSKSDCGLIYYLDREVTYLFNVYKRAVVPTLRKLRVPGYENVFFA